MTDQTSPGFARPTTDSTPSPTTSTLNLPLGDNRATGVAAPLGSAGRASADLLFDVTGYFVPQGEGERMGKLIFRRSSGTSPDRLARGASHR